MQVAIPAVGRGTRIRQLSDPLSKPTLPARVRDPFDAGPRVATGQRSSVDDAVVGLVACCRDEPRPSSTAVDRRDDPLRSA